MTHNKKGGILARKKIKANFTVAVFALGDVIKEDVSNATE